MITVPQTTPPSILYKYYPPERVDVIQGLEIRFSPPSDFNDAFDTYHRLPRASGMQVKLGRQKLRYDLGVFCLTEQANNHLMWVHYARNHTGFVLGFRTDVPFFDQGGRTLRKVIYQERPPLFDTPDENACFYKSPGWRYEDEWRCVRGFSRSEQRLVEIEPTLVTEIILGHQMEPWTISTIAWYAGLREINATFSQSSPVHSEWKFVNKRKKVVPCEHCSSQGFLMEDL